MKKVLLTGTNGYIGASIKSLLESYIDEYSVEVISLRNDKWRDKDFSIFDTIIHLAAIVHSPNSSPSLYDEVNVKLTCDLAEKAKIENVSHFVFLSTMGVYDQKLNEVTLSTSTNPTTPYAKSKLAAEEKLKKLEDENFVVSILRPPFVYGKKAPGNYRGLSKLARITPIFPIVNNKRSMIYVENLSYFIKGLIDTPTSGTFYPQDEYYVNTYDMVKRIAGYNKRKIVGVPLLNYPIKLLARRVNTINKVFGDFYYDSEMTGGPNEETYKRFGNYNKVSYEESLKRTET